MALDGRRAAFGLPVVHLRQVNALQCTRRRPRRNLTVRAAIPGLEWVLFFVLVNRFGSGRQAEAPAEQPPAAQETSAATETGQDLGDSFEPVALGETCRCGSGRDYAECCQPIHEGRRFAESPSELLRARFSAYAYKNTGRDARLRPLVWQGQAADVVRMLTTGFHEDFILGSTHEHCKDWVPQSDSQGRQRWRNTVEDFCNSVQPVRITILDEKRSERELTASVLFRAELRKQGAPVSFVEKSKLIKSTQGYVYLDGKLLNVLE